VPTTGVAGAYSAAMRMPDEPRAPLASGTRRGPHLRSPTRRRRVAAAVAAAATLAVPTLALAVAPPPAAADSPTIPDGLVTGTPHVLRLRPRLRTLPRQQATPKGRRLAAARAAIASCDPARLTEPARVPTTGRGGDAVTACVVLPVGSGVGERRAFLGAARIAGDDVADVARRRSRHGYDLTLRLSPRGAEQLAAATPAVAAGPLLADLDGRVIGTATVIPTASDASTTAPPRRLTISTAGGFDADRVNQIIDLVRQSRSEQLIALADGATMTRHARELLGRAAARVDDKPSFIRDCPSPDAATTLVLGCYGGRDQRIYVLRVERPDLAGVMTVTAAHEMLHAAFDELSRDERRRIVDELDTFMTTTGDQRISDLLAQYARQEPHSRDTELYALAGTQVRDLPRPIERHYRRYFVHRSRVVASFDAYENVFDSLQAHYEELLADIHRLGAQADAARSAADAAGAEADRLYRQIEALRAQGRFAESNSLVAAQNATADRANGLAAQFNSLVAEYNAKVAEINALAITINDTYNSIRPIPVQLPAPA
jgi:hypothetical protein